MELEVRSLDAATRRELSKKVDQYKKSLAALADDHKKIREKEEREGLFGDRDGIAVRCLILCLCASVSGLMLTLLIFLPSCRCRPQTSAIA